MAEYNITYTATADLDGSTLEDEAGEYGNSQEEAEQNFRGWFAESHRGYTLKTVEVQALVRRNPRVRRKVFGPYRVKNIGIDGDVYEVVEMVDNTDPRTYQELRPRKTYLNRQPAFGKCLRLNRRWQQDHMMEDELLQYWQEATN